MNAETMNMQAIAETNDYVSRLHDENSQLRAEIELLKKERIEDKKIIKGWATQYHCLSSSFINLNAANENAIMRRDDENSRLMDEKWAMEDENSQLSDDLQRATHIGNVAQKTIDHLNERVDSLKHEKWAMEDEIARLKIENEKLNRKIHAAVVYGRLPS